MYINFDYAQKGVTAEMSCGKMIVRDGWVICPNCSKGKLLKINADTAVKNLPCKCKRCTAETLVNIDAPEPASCETSA